jgi:hypothetical protein
MKRTKHIFLIILLTGSFITLISNSSAVAQIFDNNGNGSTNTNTNTGSGIDAPVFQDNTSPTSINNSGGSSTSGTTSADGNNWMDDDPGGPVDPVDDIPLDGGVAVLLAVGIASGYSASKRKVI